MYTLLVIDMQRGFLKQFVNREEKRKVIENCRRAIVRAIADGAEIINVNYRSHGPTIPEISDLWKKYKKMFRKNVKKVVKDKDGGGFPIIESKPQHSKMLVCGINLGACVGSTVEELRDDHNQEIFIIKEAVANSWGGCGSDLKRFEKEGILVNMG